MRALAHVDRNQLMATLLDELTDTMARYEQGGLAPFAPEWNRLHAFAGQEVFVFGPAQNTLHGIAAGIDGHGRLLLDTADGRLAVSAGDVSLRALSGVEDVVID